MAFDNHDAEQLAVRLVETGLANGTIKLQGSPATNQIAENVAKHDAAYLSALIRELKAGLQAG